MFAVHCRHLHGERFGDFTRASLASSPRSWKSFADCQPPLLLRWASLRSCAMRVVMMVLRWELNLAALGAGGWRGGCEQSSNLYPGRVYQVSKIIICSCGHSAVNSVSPLIVQVIGK
ncbi:hypothetical protein GGI52_003938 [Pseudomonas moraviensis]|uniref:Uncharacterized protein n=1 Tax=Pseudomonas moraviensis TaxID=321662 RepID=A0A7Z0AVZ1_9PSED|nr:hypothetical protein [Pseudomonas moraviensis]